LKKPRKRFVVEFDSNIKRIANMRITIGAIHLVARDAAGTMDLLGDKAG
jgi:acyl-CoA dehydrogenase